MRHSHHPSPAHLLHHCSPFPPPPYSYLPVLQLVTLATLPAAGLYAIGGLLASPLVIPALILKNLAVLAIFTPFLLLTLPVALPVGFVLAALCLTHEVCKALSITFTPLLWPLYFLCKW